MKVVLLCGGLGTRLREETTFRPKPMVEIGGKPVLWHIMKTFAHHGINEFIVCVGYRGEAIREYFLDYQARNNDFTIRLDGSSDIEFHDRHLESDWRVTVAETGRTTPTGGRVHLIDRHLGKDERFMVTYGDGLADVDIGALLRFHESHGKTASVTAVQPTERFGLLELDVDGMVQRFVEKPKLQEYVSAGYFVFEREVMDLLGPKSVLEQEPLMRLAEARQLAAFRHHGFWQPMDTYRESQLLNELWEGGSPPWKVWP